MMQIETLVEYLETKIVYYSTGRWFDCAHSLLRLAEDMDIPINKTKIQKQINKYWEERANDCTN